jgi:hypothetical protein
MPGLLPLSSWAVGLLVAGLTLTPAPLRAPLRTDLDSFTDQQLDRDLQDELDDVFADHRPGDVGDVETMQRELIEALSDEDDEGAEMEISLSDLEAEMQESGTSVADVVHDALENLDQAALPKPRFHLAVHVTGTPAVDGRKPTYSLAVRDVKRGLIRQIRASR